MVFELTILGVNAATPAYGRHPTAQTLQVGQHLFLIDCGEGTQMRMLDYHIRKSRIQHIFISHLHGDHIYGLIGLLTSYTLNNRNKPMHIYAPEGLQAIIELQLELTAGGGVSFPLHFHTIDTTQHQLILEHKLVEVYSIPLYHRVPTSGFLFKEKQRPLNVIPEKLNTYNIPYTAIPAIKAGADFTTPEGQVVPNSELTLPPYKTRSYAYCSDTRYYPVIIPWIVGVDLLYHESTFLHDRLTDAEISMHTTALEAAKIAKAANVGQLILGHYSARYANPTPLLEEAKTVFENVVLGEEGMKHPIETVRSKQ